MTRSQLLARTKKELAQLAHKRGIADWQTLSKEELVEALVRRRRPAPAAAPPTSRRGSARHATNGRPRPQTAAARTTSGRPAAKKAARRSPTPANGTARELTAKPSRDLPAGHGKDRVVVMVRDPYWLHCYWELTRHAVQRAEAALGQEWHTAKPILRLLDVSSHDTTSTSESVVRDLDIHGGCNNWYIDVINPPRSYRVDLGYVARSGRFYVLGRSNVVTTPKPGVSDAIDKNWADFDADQADRIYAMSNGFDASAGSREIKQLFEERLRRPLGSPAVTSFGPVGGQTGRGRKFFFQVDAELIVYGATEPHSRVTIHGEPVKLRPDGTFTMRYSLPDSRQIIPADAVSPDGIEKRTIVLAVERNTKTLEPVINEGNE